MNRVTALAAASALLVCDAQSAGIYGELKATLRAQGRPIPENDLWIAAVARQHGLTLVSRDDHFTVVPGLDMERWQD